MKANQTAQGNYGLTFSFNSRNRPYTRSEAGNILKLLATDQLTTQIWCSLRTVSMIIIVRIIIRFKLHIIFFKQHDAFLKLFRRRALLAFSDVNRPKERRAIVCFLSIGGAEATLSSFDKLN